MDRYDFPFIFTYSVKYSNIYIYTDLVLFLDFNHQNILIIVYHVLSDTGSDNLLFFHNGFFVIDLGKNIIIL